MLENDLTPIDNLNRSEEFKEGYKAYGYYVVNPYELVAPHFSLLFS